MNTSRPNFQDPRHDRDHLIDLIPGLQGDLNSILYALFVHRGAFYADAHTGSEKELSYITHGIAGEAGEFVDVVKKICRESHNDTQFQMRLQGHFPTLVDELSDSLWYIQAACNYLGITLEQLMFYNTLKLTSRHKQPWPTMDTSASQEG